jgi:hypothetical protein
MPTKKRAKQHPICPKCGLRHRRDTTRMTAAEARSWHRRMSAKRGTRNIAEGKQHISLGEFNALHLLKKREGNKWKSLLREMWTDGSYHRHGYSDVGSELQRLRNRLGPSWLNAFRIDAAQRPAQNPSRPKRRSPKRNPSPAARAVINEKGPRIELNVKRDADWDEWIVRTYRNGKNVERLAYHTGDKAEALSMLPILAEDMRKVFAQRGDIPPPIRARRRR